MTNEQIFAIACVGLTALVLIGRYVWNLRMKQKETLRVMTPAPKKKVHAEHRAITDIEIVGGSHNHSPAGK